MLFPFQYISLAVSCQLAHEAAITTTPPFWGSVFVSVWFCVHAFCFLFPVSLVPEPLLLLRDQKKRKALAFRE